jgi:hypothetical protein
MGFFAFFRILGKGRPPPDAETDSPATPGAVGSVADMEIG